MKYLMFLAILAAVIPTYAGNETGHGGDFYSFEFIQLGKTLSKELQRQDKSWRSLVDASKFAEAVESVLVVSDEAEKVKLPRSRVFNGQTLVELLPVDAINYPAIGKILLNRTHWRQATLEQKLLLVLHEYFGIIDVERDHFNVSSQMTPLLEYVYSNLSKNKSSIVQYYGRCVGTLPLNKTMDICDNTAPQISDAINCANHSALNKCIAELGKKNCSVITTELVAQVSSSSLGYRYCEVTSVSKTVSSK